jgi:hypothetical protein
MLYVMRVVALPIVCQAKRSRGIAAVLLLCAAACARTGLSAGDLGDGDLGAGDASSGGSATSGDAGKPNGGAPVIDPLPTSGRSPVQMGGTSSLPISEPTACVPSTEACNGRDDDCNGAVDDVPAEACPGGGFRYCVAARLSECPRRCDVCVAGSVRICQNPFCSFWGEQECAADGQGFGHCREAQPPPECRAIARKFENSKELERCCLENGYCCLDQYDIDGDGDRGEMLGACGDIACQ